MPKVKFTRGFQGVATNELFFEAGQEWEFDDDTAAQLVKENAAEIVLPELLPPAEEQPAPAKIARRKAK